MVYSFKLKIGISEFNLTLTSKLKDNQLKYIRLKLEEIYTDVNSRIKESDAYRFNKAQINIPIFVNSYFLKYIEWINKIYSNHSDLFKPFNLKGDSFLDNVVIDNKNLTIVKLKDFEFESTYFKNEFLILELINILNSLDINEYLINIKSLYFGKGIKYWKIEENNITSKIKNEFAMYIDIEVEDVMHDKISVKKFGAINDEINEISGFLISHDVINLSINSKLLKFINSKSSLIKFLKERELKLDKS